MIEFLFWKYCLICALEGSNLCWKWVTMFWLVVGVVFFLGVGSEWQYFDWLLESSFFLVFVKIEMAVQNLYTGLSCLRSDLGFTFAAGFPFFMLPPESWRSERGKIETLHFVSIDSLRLSALTHVLRPCAGNIPVQVEGQPGLIHPHITLCLVLARYTAYADDVSVLGNEQWVVEVS